jgi:serine/threonine protein kinase
MSPTTHTPAASLSDMACSCAEVPPSCCLDPDAEVPPTCFVAPDVVAQASLPEPIGGYEVLGELGRGAFGVVYRARDIQLKRPVAIKMLQVGPHASEDELARFRAEAETLASLQHSNIVQVFNAGVHRGTPYLVMELVDGGNLSQQLRGRPRLAREAAALVEVLARTMHAAHSRGIVHRDLKPANILLSSDGTPKVTDFGLAKRLDHSLGLSQTGQALGTPSYMAPEQAEGKEDVGPAADVYALGALLYEMLTGRPPFGGPDILAVLDQVRSADPISPSRLVPRLPRGLCTICLKCLEKNPARRFASAGDLADDLRHFLDGQAIVARPVSRLQRLCRVVRRRPWQTGLAAAAVLVVVLSGLLSVVLVEGNRQNKLAEQKRQQELQILLKNEQLSKFTEDEYNRSLGALDGILDLVLKGSLRNKPGLEPLHGELLGYYEKLIERQEHSDLAPPEKLAEACLHLGQLIRKTGKLAHAHNALDKAERLYLRLQQAAPEEPRLRHQLARALLERGRVNDEVGGQAAAAGKDYLAALKLLERLVQERPVEQPYRRTQGEVLHWSAVLYAKEENNPEKALGFFNRALTLRRKLDQGPGATVRDHSNLAHTQGARGDLLLKMGRVADADVAYWESHLICEKLAKGEKASDEVRSYHASSYANLAGYQTRVRSLGTAVYCLKKALEIRHQLVTNNPAMTKYKADLAETQNDLAELLLLRATAGMDEKERRERAGNLACAAESIYREQMKNNEQTDSVRLGLARSLGLHARLVFDSSPDEARQLLRDAMDLLKKLLRQRETAEVHYQMAAVYSLMAEKCEAQWRVQVTRNAIGQLELAGKKRFHRLHPEDVKQDRAFKVLHDHPAFRQFLAVSNK